MASTIKVDNIRGSAGTEVKLGGNVDVNGNSIVSASNGNIAITPNGSGKVIVDGLSLPTSDGSADQLLKTDGSANISFTTLDISKDPTPELGGDLSVAGNNIVSASNGNINLIPNGTGDVILGADTVMVGDNNADATITTQGTGDLTLSTNSGTNSGTIAIADGANGNISITPNGSGNIVLDGLTFPNADGSADQLLKTNGSGTLSFADVGGGKILQVVSVRKNDSFSRSSNSYAVVTGLTADITPSATTSKILIIVTAPYSGTNGSANATLFKDGVNYIDAAKDSGLGLRVGCFHQTGNPESGANELMQPNTYTIVDSPNSTSSITYDVRAKASGGTIRINNNNNPDNGNYRPCSVSTITLMEIGA